MGGTYYLQSGTLATGALLAGLAVGFPAAAVLTVNNHRDRTEDRLDGRRTLAILVGERASGTIYAALVLAPFGLLPSLAAGSGGWGWLPLVLLYVAFDAILVKSLMAGAESCGCFGSKVKIPPAVMLGIASVLLIGVLAARPWSSACCRPS